MRQLLAFAAAACLALVPTAAAGSQPAVLFLADEAAPMGDGALSGDMPDQNVSSVRVVMPAPTEELLTLFATSETGGSRLYGPSWVAFWPDQPMAENGSMLRATLRIDGQSVAEGTTPIHVDPQNLPDPMAFIPPDPTDPEGAAFHIVGQALPYVFTPPKVVHFGFLDVEVPANASVAVTFEVVPGGDVPIGSVALKYDAIPTPSYVYMPWWVPDPPPETGTQGPGTTPTPGPAPTPTPTETDEGGAGKDSPGLPLAVVLTGLAFLAIRRRL